MKQPTLLHWFQKTGETKEQSAKKTPSKPANEKRTPCCSVIVTRSKTTNHVVDLLSDSEPEDSSSLHPLAIHKRSSSSSSHEDIIQQNSKDRDSSHEDRIQQNSKKDRDSEKKVNDNKMLEDEEECLIVEAPTQTLASTTSDNDKDVEIVGATGPNALEDFPHPRQNCVSFPMQKNPRLFCTNCYCYVCDVRASACPRWTSHCEAKAGVYGWERKRKKKRTKRKQQERVRKGTVRRKSTPVTYDDFRKQTAFPQLLMKVLSDGFASDAISWLPHGRSFMIHKEEKFADQVLPIYFKATGYSFTHFTHSLRRWGFCQVERGPNKGAYYRHDFFSTNPDNCLHHHHHQEPPTTTPTTVSPYSPLISPGGMMPYYYGAMPYDMHGTPMHSHYYHHWPVCPEQYYYPVPFVLPYYPATTPETRPS